MTHAIFVRHIDSIGSEARPLATDIDDAETASRIAERIADSFPMHGRDGARGTYWFVNREGLHELVVT